MGSHCWKAIGRTTSQDIPQTYGKQKCITVRTRALHWSVSSDTFNPPLSILIL
jgi:hypothetical protein